MLYRSATTELSLEKTAKLLHFLQDSQLFFLAPPMRIVEQIRKKRTFIKALSSKDNRRIIYFFYGKALFLPVGFFLQQVVDTLNNLLQSNYEAHIAPKLLYNFLFLFLC